MALGGIRASLQPMGLRGCVLGCGMLVASLAARPALAQTFEGALIFCRDGTTCDGDTFHQLANVLSYEGLAPVTQARELPADLTPYRLVFAMAPVNELPAEEEERLANFFVGGGFLVLASEAVGYSPEASVSFNRILGKLGYDTVFELNNYDALCTKYGSVSRSEPITAGVSEIMYAFSTGIVNASLTPVIQGESGQVLVATAERLVVVADSNAFSDYCGTWVADGNTRLVQNIVAAGSTLSDFDGDGIADEMDNCPTQYNPDQADGDGNGVGDVCDVIDSDGDGIFDARDNCSTVPNGDQANMDGDSYGDACDPDIEGDLVPNARDNCPLTINPQQEDVDGDRVGDACDGDRDNDSLPNLVDPCPLDPRNQCVLAGGAGGVGAAGGVAGIAGGGPIGGAGAIAGGGFGAVGATGAAGGFGATSGGVGATGGSGGVGATTGGGGSGQGAIGGVGAMAGASGAFPEDDFIELSGRGCSCGIAGQRGVSRAGLAAVFLGLAWARRARRRACVEGRRGSAA